MKSELPPSQGLRYSRPNRYKFVLNDGFHDSENMKEYLSYELLTKLGVPTTLYSDAAVYLNGEYLGLYLMIESIEEDFAERNFGTNYGQLYKSESPNDMVVNMGDVLTNISADTDGDDGNNRGNDLMYTDDNPGSYSNIFDLAVFETVTNDDKQRVITAIKNLNAGTIPSTWNSQNADSSTLIDDADSQTNPESSHLLDGTLSES